MPKPEDYMSDKEFCERYSGEAKMFAKMVPLLCHDPRTAVMALATTLVSVALSGAHKEGDADVARSVVTQAVDAVFMVLQHNREREKLETEPAAGEA